ncbi:MAG TPA: hypothetical protein V6D28_13625 [Leptolyngbyaceae cyanobacterium]
MQEIFYATRDNLGMIVMSLSKVESFAKTQAWQSIDAKRWARSKKPLFFGQEVLI